MLKTNSFFLFGARGVGKTMLIKSILPKDKTLYIDLLDPDEFDRYVIEPGLLKRQIDEIRESDFWISIDEIQKVPRLLDIVHQNLESKSPKKFALSGSSARKLKRGGANLLAGRAFSYSLFPFTHKELKKDFNLEKALQFGTLPKAYLSETKEEASLYLRSYVQTYLREEIQIEQVIRRLDPFRKFLQIAAQSNGALINFSKIGSNIGVSDKTVRSYFEILEDTLLGFLVEPYHTSVRKRQKEAPKFYFFDCGVQRALSDRLTQPVTKSTYEYGKLFEHFIILELKRLSEYKRNDFRFSYLRTKDDAEIDLIIERPGKKTVLLEIKSAERVTADMVRTLNVFYKDMHNVECICLSNDEKHQRIGAVSCIHWIEGINLIFGENA